MSKHSASQMGRAKALADLIVQMDSEQHDQMSLLTNSVSSLSRELLETKCTLKEQEVAIRASNKEQMDKLVSGDQLAIALNNDFDLVVAQNIQENVDSLQIVQGFVEIESEKNINSLVEKSAVLDCDLVKLLALEAGLQQLVDSSMAERLKVFIETDTVLNSKFDEVNSYASECSESTSKSNDSLLKDVAILKIHYKSFQKNILKEIGARNSEFEALVKSELAKDVPSGQTPQKSTFQYPTDLVQTSPHPSILQRYRANPDTSMTAVEELFETTESDSSVAESTTSNSENMVPQKSRKAKNKASDSKIARSTNSISSKSSSTSFTKSNQQLFQQEKAKQALQARGANC